MTADAKVLQRVDVKGTTVLELVYELKYWQDQGYEAWLEARRCGLFIVGRKVAGDGGA